MNIISISLAVVCALSLSGPSSAADTPGVLASEPDSTPLEITTPDYSRSMAYSRGRARTVAQLSVSPSGNVEDVRIIAGVYPGFDNAARAALCLWRYMPASRPFVATVTIDFRPEFVSVDCIPAHHKEPDITRTVFRVPDHLTVTRQIPSYGSHTGPCP